MVIGLPVVLFLASVPTAAIEAADRYVAEQMEKRRIPGLSLAVVRDGQVVHARGYGLANVELDVKATAETVYQSGSVGKQFTATAVMMLVEEGKLGLDDELTRLLPGSPPHWKGITVRHLLSHTSGIKDYSVPLWHEYTDGDLFRAFAEPPLDFPVGEKWSYSNTGYALLGFVIEKVTGKFYGDFLRERVFEPLGMTATRVISEADIVRNRASGYRLVDGALKNQEWVAPSLNRTADGALYFTVLDVARWDAALYTEKLLKTSSLQQMWTPARLNNGLPAESGDGAYGFGWRMGEHRGHRKVEHGGSWQGFRTQITRFVDDRLTVIALCNLAGCDPGSIAYGVAGIVEPALKGPSAMETARDPDASRTKKLQAFAAAQDDDEDEDDAPKEEKDAPLRFLGCDDVRGRGFERAGKAVASICYYRRDGKDRSRSFKFWLQQDGSPADVAETY
jgi:CubicO group peptidase (beta-lactamase class C family)